MKRRLALLSLFATIGIASFCIGQGKQAEKSQSASDVKMSDHDKIEKLLVEVAELRKKLDGLTQRYNTHTHRLRNLQSARLPRIECDQTVVQWSSTGINSGPVDKVCRQPVYSNIDVLVLGMETTVTEPPR